MKQVFKRASIAAAVIGVALLGQGAVLFLLGARINTTRSIPLGLYWRIDAPAGKGGYVMFCPPPVGVFQEARARGYIGAGFCPGNYGYLMKKVVAATGDRVVVTEEGVRVNGTLLALSAPLGADRSGRSMPRFQADSYTLSEYQLLLMGDINPRSFDARYFGPIQRGQVKDVIAPVFIWGEADPAQRKEVSHE